MSTADEILAALHPLMEEDLMHLEKAAAITAEIKTLNDARLAQGQ